MNTLKMNVFDKYEAMLREVLGDEEFAQYRTIMEKGVANEKEGSIPERGQARVELAEELRCTPGKVTVRIKQLRRLMQFHTDPDICELAFNQAPIWRLVRIVLAKQEENMRAEQEVAEQLAERVTKQRETEQVVTKQKETSEVEQEVSEELSECVTEQQETDALATQPQEIPVSNSEEDDGQSLFGDDVPHGEPQVELSDRTLFERDFARPREEKIAEYYAQQLGVASQESMLKLFSKKEIANLLERAVTHAVMANEEWLHALLGTDSLRNDLHESDVKRNRAEEEREILFRKNLQLQRQLVEKQELLFALEEELEEQQRVQAAFCKLVEML